MGTDWITGFMCYDGVVKRRLFNLLTLTTLILAIVIFVAWLSSYFFPVTLLNVTYDETTHVQRIWVLSEDTGRLSFNFWQMQESDPAGVIKPSFRLYSPNWRGPEPDGVRTLVLTTIEPFGLWSTVWKFTADGTGTAGISVHFWELAILLAVVPAIWLCKHMRLFSRISQGHCRQCGYDPRATPTRCPECGTEVKSQG